MNPAVVSKLDFLTTSSGNIVIGAAGAGVTIVNGVGLPNIAPAPDAVIGRNAQTGAWALSQYDGVPGEAPSVPTTWATSVTWVDVKSGDINGDGKADLVGRVLQTGQWWVALSTPSGAYLTELWTTWSPNVTWVDVQLVDLNGDGKADLIGRVQETGQWWAGVSTGSAFVNSLWGSWSTAVTWVDVQSGDFNGDGKADLVGRVLQTGQWWVGLSTGSSLATSLWTTWSPAVTWVDVQVGDLNGDGKADLVGRVQETGQWWVGLSTGSSFTTALWSTWSTGVTWVDVHLGDLNGDGKMDLVGRAWRAASGGRAYRRAPVLPPACGTRGPRR